MSSHYDIIGDIHGYALTLQAMLEKLGYVRSDGVYRHSEREAIFLGDFVDRGPRQRQVIDTVRPMIESGAALSVMANHEFNAIAFATESANGGYLRQHSEKNLKQHAAFLQAYPPDGEDYAEVIEWFKTLPMWLDLGSIRVIHACWDPDAMEHLLQRLDGKPYLTDEVLGDACDWNSETYRAVETLIKGKEVRLPAGVSYPDKEGTVRHHMRIRWWDEQARTHRDAFFGSPTALTHIPDDPIDTDHLIVYAHDEPPVFLGHYWLEGTPEPLAPNIACLDYSVGKGEKLVAYRWDGESKLAADKFVSVAACD